MAYAFKRSESVGDAARRVAAKQLRKAVDELDQRDDTDLRAVVHGVRKRSKRVRAVARLVRSGLGPDYRRTNVTVRDAARLLSPIRDGHALLGTFDALVAAADRRPSGDLSAVRSGLADRARDASERAAARGHDVEEAIALFREGLSVVEGWDIDDGSEVLADGLETTYRRGRDGFQDALASPSPEAFHEWRKGTKHLWHQTQLLERSAPSVLTRQAHALHHLADALGDDHDLAVLVGILRDDAEAFGGDEPVTAAVALAEERRADLERRALRLGARLHVEKPKAFVARMTGYWEVWQEHGDEEETGEIGVVAPPDDGHDDRTRAELYALARAAGLPGRSSLTRDDLIAALRALGR